MNKEKIKDSLNEIHLELAYLRAMVENVTYQMQELQQRIGESSDQDEELSVRESYEHPWYKYKRQELIASGNYTEPKRGSSTNSK